MKQIPKTDDIIAKLRKSAGQDIDVNAVSVFEAIALNTLPLRKSHPLYRGAIAERSLLLEMAAALELESRPIQLQHQDDDLPTGRVFHGEVQDFSGVSELRVLFFVDNTSDEIVRKIDAGTIDQVSVGMLPKHIYSSKSGFDFFGEDSTIENIINGTDPDGNVLGENGVYGRMVGLDKWFELSLVGLGGAQNAKIVNRDQSVFGSSYQKLAASGMDPNSLVLVASARKNEMDLTQLVEQLTNTKVELAQKIEAVTGLEAQIAANVAKIAELEAKLAETGDVAATLTAKDAEIATLTADVKTATATLSDVATKLLTAAGKVTEKAPEKLADLTAMITERSKDLVAALVAGGKSLEASGDASKAKTPVSLGAYRSR